MENSHLPDATQAAYARILDGLRITDQSALERILKVLAMLDDIRWGHPVNYSRGHVNRCVNVFFRRRPFPPFRPVPRPL